MRFDEVFCMCFEGIVKILVYERIFEGCGGLWFFDEVCVMICGNVVLFLLGGVEYFFDWVMLIFVYLISYVCVNIM